MAGLILDADIAALRERANLEDLVSEHTQLKNAGSDRVKGLCPFHDEKSPSFSVNRSLGYYHCFGCGVSGDVITFVREIDHLSFVEAVEQLARRYGMDLRYTEGGSAPVRDRGQTVRLLDAHVAAAEFFAEQLSSPEAAPARQFLAGRGFDRMAARTYGCGYSPDSWDTLIRHLRGRGFTDAELLLGGLASEGRRGPIDRFRGRLMWPIRDTKSDVIGFGARKLLESDQGPKYLNTPETPLYKKSKVLYGVDLAKGHIARSHRAVVVEGYTDVMACHLAGEPTAVATCGTSFGGEHISVLRRLLMDQDEFRGEVIFTFDGDAAGQKAALRAFDDDQKFVTQTFVAVEAGGLDPCDLRQQQGDAAVRDLVARRVPLFEFAVRSTIGRYDLDTTEGRLAALDAAAPVVGQIREWGLRKRYAVNLDSWLGLNDEQFVLQRVAEMTRAQQAQQASRPPRSTAATVDGGAAPGLDRPDPKDPATAVEREALKVAVQRPALAGPLFDGLEPEVFTHTSYRAVQRLVADCGGAATSAGGQGWVQALSERASVPGLAALVGELAVEPVRSAAEIDERYAAAVVARLAELSVTRRIAVVRGRLQRLNPVENESEHRRLFGELVALEQHKRGLREQGIATL